MDSSSNLMDIAKWPMYHINLFSLLPTPQFVAFFITTVWINFLSLTSLMVADELMAGLITRGCRFEFLVR